MKTKLINHLLMGILSEKDRELFPKALKYFGISGITEFFLLFSLKAIQRYKMRPICSQCEENDADLEAYSYKSRDWHPVCNSCRSAGWDTRDLVRSIL